MNPGPGLIQGAHLHLDIHSNYLSLLMEWEIEFEKILPIFLGMNQKVFINGKYFSNTFLSYQMSKITASIRQGNPKQVATTFSPTLNRENSLCGFLSLFFSTTLLSLSRHEEDLCKTSVFLITLRCKLRNHSVQY